jgi:hypothetical protein
MLGSLSMLLNGGGVAQIRMISIELNHALGQRAPGAPSGEPEHANGAGRPREITRVLDGINRLATLAARGEITSALDDLQPGWPSWTASVASRGHAAPRLASRARPTSSTTAGRLRRPAFAAAHVDEARRVRPELLNRCRSGSFLLTDAAGGRGGDYTNPT